MICEMPLTDTGRKQKSNTTKFSQPSLSMKMKPRQFLNLVTTVTMLIAGGVLRSSANDTPQAVPLVQKWSDAALITTDNDWSKVPGFVGYRGDKLTTKIGANPQTIVSDGMNSSVSVYANQSKPNTFRSGGVSEFDGIPDPVVALKGSQTASAPFLLLNLNTKGKKNVGVGYTLRDLDGSANNAVQPVAFQYRLGTNGNFTDIPAAYVADATTGPTLNTQATPVVVMLPVEAWDQYLLQVRWITANAEGNDEWVGIDDIAVVADEIAAPPTAAAADEPANSKRSVEPLRSPRDASSR